ncbi:tetratricopeptide repeat-containing sensor histidine kinase [Spirosoma panaciterrae]|uniref:tetratricopeptide repeat-containing sensor histidine kinase n=1 Tax=Spirosoma panaciterrae TaxID=496058 RepID=UPI0012FB40C8|nr:histidine kinase [Spirosoma panaciterrae]
MDSISRLAKRRYNSLTNHQQSSHNDTLRFETLLLLGRIYRWWPGRYDSVYYYGNILIQQAQKSQNLLYQVKGTLLHEDYYRTVKKDNTQALRINFGILALLEKRNQDPFIGWRVDLNLSTLYSLAGDYDGALRYLQQAQARLAKGSGLPPTPTIGFKVDIEQNIGLLYNRQNNFAESEKHYLAAEALLTRDQPLSNFGYVYGDLAELYIKYEYYGNALIYARKTEQIWSQISHSSPTTIINNWSVLACAYAGLRQDSLAMVYAQKILQNKKIFKPALQRAYQALYQIYEHQQAWGNSLLCFKKYIALRDTAVQNLEANKLAALQKQNELDRQTLLHEQAQALQAQRLFTLQKQAELDRLRAKIHTDALTKKALLTEQQRRIDNQKAQLLLTRQQSQQKQLQNHFQQERLYRETQLQRNRLFYVGSTSLFLIGVLVLLLYTQQLRKRRSEAILQLTQTRAEANVRILNAQDSERQRIAADLHDDLGGAIATISHQLSQSLQTQSLEELQQKVQRIQQVTTQAGAKVRTIAHNLMPPDFERIGLVESVQELINSLNDFRFRFASFGEIRRLPSDVELNAYRILSELIHNVQKHAQAQHVFVQLLFHEDRLSLVVEDDGTGNSLPLKKIKSQGIGLKNIAARVNYLHAHWQTDASEQGTTTLIEIPYTFNVNQ